MHVKCTDTAWRVSIVSNSLQPFIAEEFLQVARQLVAEDTLSQKPSSGTYSRGLIERIISVFVHITST